MKKLVIPSFLFSFILLCGLLSNAYANINVVDSKEIPWGTDFVDGKYKRSLRSEALVDVDAMEEDSQKDFFLEIPSIGLSKKVIPNVDPRETDIYMPVIDTYVAHGMFTKLPDQATQDGNVYLFAHRDGLFNGRPKGFFRDLDQMKEGDLAIIKYDGRVYEYVYRDSKIIDPTDTSVYTGNSDKPTLTMQTCENGEAQRLIVSWDLISVAQSDN